MIASLSKARSLERPVIVLECPENQVPFCERIAQELGDVVPRSVIRVNPENLVTNVFWVRLVLEDGVARLFWKDTDNGKLHESSAYDMFENMSQDKKNVMAHLIVRQTPGLVEELLRK